MKITNAINYAILQGADLPALADIEAKMLEQAFTPCGASQESSSGFVPRAAKSTALYSRPLAASGSPS